MKSFLQKIKVLFALKRIASSGLGRMGITVSERFIKQTKVISRSFEDQQLIVRDMIRMMRKTLKKIQTIYVKDLLYGLIERNMGTPDVINSVNRMLGNRD